MPKILIVDDDADILELVRMTLSMNNFETAAVSRGHDIESSIINFEPDLILLDIAIAGADGRVICRHIKSNKETQHIPVLLFSANVETENSFKDCLADGAIAKPFQLSYLLGTIKKHLTKV